MEELLTMVLNQYMSQLPSWAISLLLIMASLRVIFKPLMALIQVSIKETPSKKDDAWLEKAMKSSTYKTISFMLDWVASLKLPKKPEK